MKNFSTKNLTGIFLLAAILLLFLPAGKAYAANYKADDIVTGTVLNLGDGVSSEDDSQPYWIVYHDSSGNIVREDKADRGYTIQWEGKNQWTVTSIQGKRILLDGPAAPAGTDASSLQVGDVLQEGEGLYSPDVSNPWSLVYCNTGGNAVKEASVLVNYSVETLAGITQWKVTSIQGKKIMLSPFVPANIDASSLQVGDVLQAGDGLYSPDASNPWSLVYYGAAGSIVKEAQVTGNYQVETLEGKNRWKVTSVQGKKILLNEPAAPAGTDASSLQVGDVLQAGDDLYSPDNSNPWSLVYYGAAGSIVKEAQVTGNYQVETLEGKNRWKVTSVQGKKILLNEPAAPAGTDASSLQVGDVLQAGDGLYSPDNSNPWSLVYYGVAGNIVKEAQVKGNYQVETLEGKTQWKVTSIQGKRILLDEPQPAGRDVTTLQVGEVLRRGAALFCADSSDPWWAVYQNPEDVTDVRKEKIEGAYQIGNVFGLETWKISQIDGERKTIVLEAEKTPDEGPEQEPLPLPEAADDLCRHEYDWEIQLEATATTAGLMRYRCTKCGDVLSRMETSGYSVFLQDTVKAVKAAKQNGTVTLETSMWESFDRSVIEALSKRPDVTLTVIYKFEGKYYTTTIPAGADLSSLLNKDGYCGFRHLDQIFGGAEVPGK